MFAELEQLRDLAPILGLHLLENLVRAFFGEIAEQVGGGVRVHFLDDVGGPVACRATRRWRPERPGSSSSSVSAATSSSMRLEHRFAIGRRQILDDVGDVGGMHLRETAIGDLQLDASRRVGFEQIDEVPRDHPRRNPLEQRPERERRDDALRETADGAARTHVDGDDVQQQVTVDGRRFELDVVDAHDLAAVDVDDLLVEEVALEQQHAVERRHPRPLRDVGVRADRRRLRW